MNLKRTTKRAAEVVFGQKWKVDNLIYTLSPGFKWHVSPLVSSEKSKDNMGSSWRNRGQISREKWSKPKWRQTEGGNFVIWRWERVNVLFNQKEKVKWIQCYYLITWCRDLSRRLSTRESRLFNFFLKFLVCWMILNQFRFSHLKCSCF